jgi:DNA adenine methylase
LEQLGMTLSVVAKQPSERGKLPPVARPFLKWAGGKGQLLEQLASLYPDRFAGYHEPFVGSAAVFFHVQGLTLRGQLKSFMGRVRLTDSNEELINCFRAVRDEVDGLITLLTEHKKGHNRSHYYKIRRQIPGELTGVERAARFIYLNKTCYNGLYRVNRKGQFNVPMGRYRNPRILDEKELRQASQALQHTEIEVADFREVVRCAKAGDFVYIDPPYHPLTLTANFTSYTQAIFGEPEQRDLARVFRDLDRKGCKVMLSNSWTPFILDLYRDFTRLEVKANRAINSDPARRGKISEVVVLNYAPPGH